MYKIENIEKINAVLKGWQDLCSRPALFNIVATNDYLNFNLNYLCFEKNLKFSSSVILTIFQIHNSHVGLLMTI